MLCGRDEVSDTEAKSLSVFVGGVGKATSVALDAVRRRWWREEESDLTLSGGAPMTPLFNIATSSLLLLLVSLLATFTATSVSPMRSPGVTGDGRGDA